MGEWRAGSGLVGLRWLVGWGRVGGGVTGRMGLAGWGRVRVGWRAGSESPGGAGWGWGGHLGRRAGWVGGWADMGWLQRTFIQPERVYITAG